MANQSRPANTSNGRPPPLAPILILIWLFSVGTGVVFNGVSFIARERFGYSDTQNLFLAFVLGITYIPGAIGIAPALRRFARMHEAISTRMVLVAVTLALSFACMLPAILDSELGLWAMAILYTPLAGCLWPIVESYTSGGRRGADLRRTMGLFNFAWASAIPVALFGVGPFLESQPLLALAGGGALQLLTLPIILLTFSREPARHVEEANHPHPPIYESLLVSFRWLLVVSYVLMAAVSPILPERLAGFGFAGQTAAWLAATWTFSRLVVFILLGVWHGWHGRWRTVIWTVLSMLAGASLVIATASLAFFVIGLVLFGVGLGGVYSAAIYYAMEVGAAKVDAGGKHEALIGVGYSLGPLAGLAGIWVAANISAIERPQDGMLICVSGLAIVGATMAVTVGVRDRRKNRTSAPAK